MSRVFERWATTKGLDLKLREDAKIPYRLLYEDPITQAAWEGYNQGGTDASEWFLPRFNAASWVIDKNGLKKDYEEALLNMDGLLTAGFANSSKGVKPGP